MQRNNLMDLQMQRELFVERNVKKYETTQNDKFLREGASFLGDKIKLQHNTVYNIVSSNFLN